MKELFRRKYLISFFYIIVCIVGFTTWVSIPVENAPELNLPSITVSYSWPSTSPEVVEQEITRKVESAASRLRDVEGIRSISSEGSARVTINFAKNAPVEFRALELREYLFALEQNLPATVNPGTINRQIPSELTDQQVFVVYSLSGDFEGRNLLEFARKNIRAQLLGIDGLAEVKLEGVQDPALIIEFKKEELEKYRLSGMAILQEIRQNLTWRNTGFIESGDSRYSLTIPPEFNNVSDVSNLRITIPGSLKQINLSDVANVRVSDYPARSIRRINGNTSLTIDFVKEGGADALSLAETIVEEMDKIRESLPEGMFLRLQRDSTEELRAQFDQLSVQAMFSALMVFIVVLLFIRKVRAPIVIIGSVLFSVLMSITLLYLFDYTLNVITLAGLTIALGMLIDNAVVVFEQINPGLPEKIVDRIEHVKEQLPRSFVPVLGSTFTTVGIFVPLLFALEELKIFLLPLAVALTLTLMSSVVIAFTWIPYSLIWLTPKAKPKSVRERRNISAKIKRVLFKMLIIRHKLRWAFVAILIGVIGIPIFLIEEPDWNEETLWPEFTQSYFSNRDKVDPWVGGLTHKFVKDTYFGSPWRRGNTEEKIYVNVRTPQGTPLSEIDKIAKAYEALVVPYEEAFSYYEVQLGESFGAYMQFSVEPEYLFEATPYIFHGEASYLASKTGNVATSVSGLNIQGTSTGFGGSSSSYSINLTGYAYEELINLANDIKRRLEKNRRVQEVDINSTSYFIRNDFQQYELKLDDEKILSKGLNKREVLSALAIDINPANSAGRVEFQGQEMYLLGISEDKTSYEDDLMDKQRVSSQTNFSLASFGSITKEKALTQIRRTDQSYERVVTLKFLGNYRMGQEYIQSVLDEVPVPIGSNIRFGRSFFNFNDSENTKNLWLVSLLSIFSVWMIVAALLESWRRSLFVLLAIPFSAVGIMLGTMVNDISFDRGAISGALLCVGVVVNNAILLIHQKGIETDRGIFGIRSWYNVFRSKMRAVLITTTTTFVGLLPMVYFGVDEFWESLALVVCWGLMFSTALIFIFSGIFDRKLLEFKAQKVNPKAE